MCGASVEESLPGMSLSCRSQGDGQAQARGSRQETRKGQSDRSSESCG